jgi:hypothetical protein
MSMSADGMRDALAYQARFERTRALLSPLV